MAAPKALFFDIDGTLLSELNGQIPESAKRAWPLQMYAGLLRDHD